MADRTSRLSGFCKLTNDERLAEVQSVAGLDEAAVEAL